MAWVRIDDQAPRNHKLLKAGPAAAWMWVCCIAHCQAHATGGFIEDIAIPVVGIRGAERARRLADTLVECGLLDRISDVNRSDFDLIPDVNRSHVDRKPIAKRSGFMVHDYLDFNETREEALARREDLAAKRAKSGRAGGLKSGASRRSNEANGKQTFEAKRSPDPTRPDLSKNPPTPFQGARRYTRADLKEAKRIRAMNFGGCRHDPTCVGGIECEVLMAIEIFDRRKAAAS